MPALPTPDTTADPPGAEAERPVRLSEARRGDAGRIVEVRPGTTDHGLLAAELERRLLEFGFVEGAVVELIHEGPIGGDPIAVRVDDMRVALRRSDARDVWVWLTARAR